MKNFLRTFTPEAAQERRNAVYQKFSGTNAPLQMPAKSGLYRLSHIVVNWNVKTVRIHLHGHKVGFINTKYVYIEKITLRRLPGMNDHDAVHAAFFVSPHKWTVPMFSPQSRYKRYVKAPLPVRLSDAIADPNISFSQ